MRMVRLAEAAVAALAVLMMIPCRACCEPTADDIRFRNAASQAAVRTFQARVEVTIQFNPSELPGAFKGKSVTDKYLFDFVRSGDKERRKELQGSALGVRDLIRDFADNKASLLVPTNGPDTAVISDNERVPVPVQFWEWALLQMPWCKQPLSRLMEEAEVKSLKATTQAGRDLVYLDIRDAKQQRYEVWVDAATNYLVRKLIAHRSHPKAKVRIEGEVLSFREVSPGVFVPERLIHSLFLNGNWFEKAVGALTDIRVNEELPPAMFEHTFGRGTMVTDNVRGITYTVGADGQPTHIGSFDPSSPPAELGSATPATADESRWTWHRTLLIGSAVVVAGGIAVLFCRRRRSATP